MPDLQCQRVPPTHTRMKRERQKSVQSHAIKKRNKCGCCHVAGTEVSVTMKEQLCKNTAAPVCLQGKPWVGGNDGYSLS